MKKIKEYWLIILLILALSIGYFYWHEYRPSNLIKSCHLWAIDRTGAIKGDRIDLEYFLNKCLRENGIDEYIKYQ